MEWGLLIGGLAALSARTCDQARTRNIFDNFSRRRLFVVVIVMVFPPPAEDCVQPVLQIEHEAEERGDEDQRDDRGNQQAAEQYCADATIEFATRSRSKHERQQADEAAERRHENRPDAGADALD